MSKLTRITAEVLRLPEEAIGDSLSFSETETWDSLSHMDLIATLEETFGVSLTAEEIVSMTDIAAIKRILGDKGADL